MDHVNFLGAFTVKANKADMQQKDVDLFIKIYRNVVARAAREGLLVTPQEVMTLVRRLHAEELLHGVDA
jgi:hypothetical protein